MSPFLLPRLRLRTRLFLWLAGFAAAILAFIVFGMPQQRATLLGLIAAGVIIALKDFLLCIVGWFGLTGRRGIRVGDLVEIDGTQGEVIEITALRTTLLEIGDWTAAGYPTGRQAVFMNKFPFEHKYFNFTTAEQWMWDQLSIAVPVGAEITPDTHARIQRLVERKTRADASGAEEAWKRLSRVSGLTDFGVTPPVLLRPSPSGDELIIRYIVKAHSRFEVSVHLRDEILAIIASINEPTVAPFVSSLAALDPNAASELEIPVIH